MTKLVSWNINRRHAAWRELLEMNVDVALLQEAGHTPPGMANCFDTGPTESWDSRTWNADYEKRWGKEKLRQRWGKAGLFDRWCKIVKLSDRVKVRWFKQISPISVVAEDEIAVSGIGTIAAACITPRDGESFIAVSMYARWLGWHPTVKSKWSVGTADGAAHRIISDISGFIGDYDPSSHRILAAGDLNMVYNPGHPEWNGSRDHGVWTRMDTVGLEFLGPSWPNGRKATRQREWLAPNSRNVPTYYTTRERTPEAASQQLDYAFASRGFHNDISVRALNGVDEWGPSDHCRLLIEVESTGMCLPGTARPR